MEGTSASRRWRLMRVLLAGGVLAIGWLAVDLAVSAESASAAPTDAIGDLLDDGERAVSTVLSVVEETVTAPVIEVVDPVVDVLLPPVVVVSTGSTTEQNVVSTGSTTEPEPVVSTGSTTEDSAPAGETPPGAPLESPTPPAPAAAVGELNSGVLFAVYAHPSASSTQQHAPASPTFDSDTTPD